MSIPKQIPRYLYDSNIVYIPNRIYKIHTHASKGTFKTWHKVRVIKYKLKTRKTLVYAKQIVTRAARP